MVRAGGRLRWRGTGVVRAGGGLQRRGSDTGVTQACGGLQRGGSGTGVARAGGGRLRTSQPWVNPRGSLVVVVDEIWPIVLP